MTPNDQLNRFDEENPPAQGGWVVLIVFAVVAAIFMFAPLFEGVQ